MFRYRYPLSRPVKILVVIFLNFGLQNFCPIARLLHTVRTLRPSPIWTGAAAVCPRPRQASASGRSPPVSTYASSVRPRFSRTFDVRPQSRPLLRPSVPSLLSFLATSWTLATRRQTCPIDYPHTQICRNQRYPPRLRSRWVLVGLNSTLPHNKQQICLICVCRLQKTAETSRKNRTVHFIRILKPIQAITSTVTNYVQTLLSAALS